MFTAFIMVVTLSGQPIVLQDTSNTYPTEEACKTRVYEMSHHAQLSFASLGIQKVMGKCVESDSEDLAEDETAI